MREDFQLGTPETDLTHLAEVLSLHDLSRDLAAGTPEHFRERCLKNVEFRAIHHHVFVPTNTSELLNEVGFSVVRQDVQKGNIVTLAKSPNPAHA
jgi:hypothetical protein